MKQPYFPGSEVPAPHLRPAQSRDRTPGQKGNPREISFAHTQWTSRAVPRVRPARGLPFLSGTESGGVVPVMGIGAPRGKPE